MSHPPLPHFGGLEVCVESVGSARAAERGGAVRIELCDNLAGGGTTPSIGMCQIVKGSVQIPVFCMIRPRSGDFCYDDDELSVMERDIEVLSGYVDGFVLGVLTAGGDVDLIRTKRLVDKARPKPVTFHRAFDMTCDAQAALEKVIEAGCTTILTSGQACSALDGCDLLHRLVRWADGRIDIMAGCGVRGSNAAEIKARTGVAFLHASARITFDGPMVFRNPQVSMAPPAKISEFERSRTDESAVRAIIAAIQENPVKEL
eukprot:Rmarinus@m.23899